jgi:hypothetical protein
MVATSDFISDDDKAFYPNLGFRSAHFVNK